MSNRGRAPADEVAVLLGSTIGGLVAVYGVETVRAKLRHIAECDDLWSMAAMTVAQAPAQTAGMLAAIQSQKRKGEN